MAKKTKPTCDFIKDDGRRCRIKTQLRETDLGLRCLWHDPSRRAEAKKARSRGGHSAQRLKRADEILKRAGEIKTVPADAIPELPGTQETCEDFYRWVLQSVLTGQLDARTAREVTNTLDSLHAAIGNRLALTKKAKELEKLLARAEADARDRGTLAT